MTQNKDNIRRVDVDKAWNILCERLEKEGLLTGETAFSPPPKRMALFKWGAVAAAVCAGFILSVFYFPRGKNEALTVLQNVENSGTLVATLNDGSTVYLAPEASISYPPVFDANRRKVRLNGSALFYVSKDEKRPFVIETGEKITIEVVGTIFSVQSALGKPFELSVKQGKVNVHSPDSQTGVRVEAGETVRLNANGLDKFQTANIHAFSRFTDKMCFKDEKLNNVVRAINTVYGSPTVITDAAINNRILTVTFEDDSVETMTNLICMALNLEKINKQDTIFIRK